MKYDKVEIRKITPEIERKIIRLNMEIKRRCKREGIQMSNKMRKKIVLHELGLVKEEGSSDLFRQGLKMQNEKW